MTVGDSGTERRTFESGKAGEGTGGMKKKKEVCLLDRREKVLSYFPGGRGYSAGGFSVLRYPVGDASDTGDRRIPDKEKGDSAEKRRKKRMTKQFGDMMTSLCVALRAGYSMENALAECTRDLGETLRGRGGTGGRVKAYPESDADQYTR